MNRAWHCEDLPALLGGRPRRDERARGKCSLNDQTTKRYPADQAIAAGKIMSYGPGAERELRYQQSLARNLFREAAVARRVAYVYAGTENRDRRAIRGEAPAMGGGVNSQSESRNDRISGAAKRAREALRVTLSLGGRVSASNDSQGRPIEKFYPPLGVKEHWRIRDLQQQLRERLVRERYDRVTGLTRPFQGLYNQLPNFFRVERAKAIGRRKARQLGAISSDDVLRETELAKEGANAGGAKTGREGKS